VDFKTYYLQDQMKDIYLDLSNAFKRADKVILSRSLSQPMYDFTTALLKEKKLNPYFKGVNGITLMQARVYAN